ncbi:nuclear transport factor 2 family protein [Epibacterium ulvae]|uniref:nuclear transport factor 2 family protein n=1 Tax=Epibacterium ulvae TaxID=1156985 RepID=UPI001BFC6662|nr:nuclear transport factor 2 family protein [Epibacterium ulvae]MBT8154624.1 nuclear transport factor 2 family protein [Epibacterium ulvae]
MSTAPSIQAHSRQAQLLIDSTNAIWVEHDLVAIDTYFASDFKVDGVLQDTSLGPDDFREFVPVIAAIMKNMRIEPLVVTETGKWVQMLYRCTATAAVGGFPINFIGQLPVCALRKTKLSNATTRSIT